MADPITVKTTAELLVALKAAPDGSTVLLAPGVYSKISYKVSPVHAEAITVRSADPANKAVITDIALVKARGLIFEDLIFQCTPPAGTLDLDSFFPFKFTRCANVHLRNVKVQGSLDGKENDGSGAGFRDCDTISVIGCEFQALIRGLAVGQTKNVEVSGNYVHDLRSDGFDFAEVSSVVISDNRFRNFRPTAVDHPDAIQFWTSGTKTASHDILISGNLVERGDGAPTQGIFLKDGTGILPYERVTISDNLIVGTGNNAIRFQGVKGLTLERNELVSFAGENMTGVLIQVGDGIVSKDNRSIGISYDKSINVTDSGNIKTAVVADKGAAIVEAWLARHPRVPGAPKTDPRDGRIAELEAALAAALNAQAAEAAQVVALRSSLSAANEDVARMAGLLKTIEAMAAAR